MKTLRLILLTVGLALAGCTSWRGLSETYENGELKTRITASMTQCLTDSSRTNMSFVMDGLGTASVGTSVLDAESLASIAKEIRPIWLGASITIGGRKVGP